MEKVVSVTVGKWNGRNCRGKTLLYVFLSDFKRILIQISLNEPASLNKMTITWLCIVMQSELLHCKVVEEGNASVCLVSKYQHL